MRVLYDYEIFMIQKYGGVTRYFYEIISRLIQRDDINISLYMGFHINRYKLEAFRDRYDKFFGKRIRHIPKTKLLFSKIHKPLFNNFEKKLNYDIFHQTYYGSYKKRDGVKRIVTVHDFTHEKLPGYFPKIDNTIAAKKNAILNADGIICISESTKKDLLGLYDYPEDKIKVIYHGNSLLYDIIEPPFIKNPYLLYVGDRRAYKNFSLLLSAFSKLIKDRKEYRMICFGGGGFKNSEKKVISELKLDDYVYQLEGSDRDLANAYKNASVFVYPSLYEGFGIPLLEAMHYECPVVASDASCFPEIGSDAVLYFNPKDEDELNQKINLILDNPEVRNNLIAKGIKREKNFSWDKCAEETFEFYKYIMGRI